MLKLFRVHYLSVILAVLIGVILIAPPLFFRFDPAYQGIDFLGTDGESSYVAQVHAVYNGDLASGNAFLYEYKDQPYVKQPLSAIITAGLGKLLWLSVPDANLAAKFVFPLITFIIIYALCFILTKRKGVALLGAAFIMLSPATTALLDPATWGPLLHQGVFAVSDPQFLVYARTLHPQVSNLLFFLYLLILWLFLDRGSSFVAWKKYLLGISAGVLLGLSFYTYLFSFTLLFAINGCLWVYFFIRRDFAKLKQLTFITLGGLLVGVPYILNMLQVFNSPYYPELAIRVGQLPTHEFVFSRVLLGLLVLFLLFYHRLDAFGVFTITFLVAVFVVSNQQVLTGRTVPIPAHYHWYYLAPVAGLIIFQIVFSWLELKSRKIYLKISKIFLLLIFLVVAVLFQRWSYSYQKSDFVDLNRYGQAIGWLKEHVTKDDVVFSNEPLAEQVVVYTPANVYYNTYAGDALVPPERLLSTYYLYMYLDGVLAEQATDYFSDPANQNKISHRIFSNYYRAKNGCYECYPDELNQQFITEYQQFVSRPFLENFKKYRVTYAVWDKEKNPSWQLERFFANQVFASGPVVIYKMD